MALLTKLRSATLIEALVATVLILVVFVISSLVLNNLLFNSFSRNTHSIENRLFELEYKVQNQSISLPYSEKYDVWDVSLVMLEHDGKQWLQCTAINDNNKKEIVKSRLCRIQK